ncbi:MAG TPA: DUF3108 domain-containing protein [Bryobacteraceae bacterium]|jgi:hypothetical protein|nr:DUF3108 domain-containing protein [Bryobacteraceae bacterium]
MTGLRWRAAIVSALLGIASAGIAQQDSPAPQSAGSTEQSGSRETLDYAVEWRLIPAGTAKLTWTPLGTAPANGGAPAASEVQLHLESTGLVSRLFRVNDDYTAMLGQNFCGQSTFMAAHEGNRSRETRVTYDQLERKVHYTERDLIKNSTTTHEVDIPACTHDVLGGLMVLRMLRIEPGKSVQIPISDGKKVAQVKIESQRREEINTPTGMQKTIRYEIFLFDNVLYKRSAHMHIWLTDDNLRLPVQLQVHLQFAIGTITFKLAKQEKS